MDAYLALCQRILDEGVWIKNPRTGVRCLTVINADFVYDVGANICPVVTTRKAPWKMAIAELIGYLRGYQSAADFRAVGTKSWDANANENLDWLANPNRRGRDDIGRAYGVQARQWQGPDGTVVDQLAKVVDNLSAGIDDRGEIVTFYNPGEFHLSALRPCMHTHTFSLVGDTLHLTSTQRSADVLIGAVANAIQVHCLLQLMAQITGHRPGLAYHKIVNCHIYEPQLSLLRDVQLKRQPYPSPSLHINPRVKTLDDVDTCLSVDDFALEGYQHHPPIRYPFTV